MRHWQIDRIHVLYIEMKISELSICASCSRKLQVPRSLPSTILKLHVSRSLQPSLLSRISRRYIQSQEFKPFVPPPPASLPKAATPPKDLPPIETKPSRYYGGEERIAHDGGNNMILGFPGSGAYTGGHYKPEIAVLSSLLGGQSYIKWSPGFSLLARATRAQTQAHVSTRNISYSDAGLLTISMGGDARHIKEASEAVVEILKAISGGDIAKDDIKKAIANAKFRTLEAGQNTGTGLELTGAGLVQSGKASQIDGIADAIEGVTEEAVKKAAKSLLDGKATVSTVGDLFVLPFAEEIGLHV